MFCRYVSTNQQQLHKGIFNFLVGKHNKAGEYVTICFGKNYSVYVMSKEIIVIFISWKNIWILLFYSSSV